MISEERVRLMTGMAMEEKKNGRLSESANMTKKEFVSGRMFLAFFVGTILYVAVFCALIAMIYIFLYVNIDIVMLVLFVLAGAIGYALTLYVVLRRTKIRSLYRYKEQRVHLKKMKKQWEELASLYAKQDEEFK